MREFVRETWPWIVAPSVLLLLMVLIYTFVLDDSPTPFIYNIY